MVAAHRISMPDDVEIAKGRERGSLFECHGMKSGGIGGESEVRVGDRRGSLTLVAIGLGS